MSVSLSALGVRPVLLDIEGTTTPMRFVHEVLFPYARRRLQPFLTEHARSPDVAEAVHLLSAEHARDLASDPATPAWPAAAEPDAAAVAAYAAWLIDRDRKSTGLKRLQGLIWDRGYRGGTLRGEVFPDVPPALQRWAAAGHALYIFSSGSEQAQRQLFQTTEAGDLTRFLSGYFDTRVGSKLEADSYRAIAGRIGTRPPEILFISDSPRELDAAQAAGMRTFLSIRPGNAVVPIDTGHVAIRGFDEIA